MSLFEDVLKGGNIATGVAVAFGAAVLAPAVGMVLRPVAKSILKTGLVAYDQGRVALAELNERAGEMVTEARSEMAHADDQSPREKPSPRRNRGHRST